MDVVSVPGRPGCKDFNYPWYDSIAYELHDKLTGEVLARAEGRDACLRILRVGENIEKLSLEDGDGSST